MKFEYAIKFPNGLYYTGEVNTATNMNAWQGEKNKAFTYTYFGAQNKIQSQFCFSNCEIEKVIDI